MSQVSPSADYDRVRVTCELPRPVAGEASRGRHRIAASLLAADLARLGEEVTRALGAGADLIHLDVMDGHYAPTLGFGPRTCEAVRRVTHATIEVHLMARPVDPLVPLFARAGADLVTFHPEASDDVDRTIALVREHGCRAGLALSPATPVSVLDWTLEKLDTILVVAATPGRAGPTFVPSSLRKIRKVCECAAERGRDPFVEVDEVVAIEDVADAARAGADTLVAGAALFGAADYRAAIDAMRERLAGVDRRDSALA